VKAVGVDLGGSNVRAARVDLVGGLIEAEARAPVASKDPEDVAAQVEAIVREVDPDRQATGVGVGFAGMLRGMTGVVVNAPNFGWRSVDLRGLLRAHLGAQVELYNDLKAIVYGEKSWGAARGVLDVLAVFIGTGLGAGLVTGGRLYIGASHLAGEMGHTQVVPNGRPCGCGKRGCLEAYTSGRHLQLRAREELARRHSLAIDLAGGLDLVHAGHLDEAARRGDVYADDLWSEVSEILGVALANAVTLVNPSRLVMGGTVWKSCPDLRRRALEHFHQAVNTPSLEGFAVVDSSLGDAAGVLGAATLAGEAFAQPTG
jgi:glucokinase